LRVLLRGSQVADPQAGVGQVAQEQRHARRELVALRQRQPFARRRQRIAFWVTLIGAKALIVSPYVYAALAQ